MITFWMLNDNALSFFWDRNYSLVVESTSLQGPEKEQIIWLILKTPVEFKLQ